MLSFVDAAITQEVSSVTNTAATVTDGTCRRLRSPELTRALVRALTLLGATHELASAVETGGRRYWPGFKVHGAS